MWYALVFYLFVFGIADGILRYALSWSIGTYPNKSRWFLLHAFGNACTLYAISPEILIALAHPESIYVIPTTFEGLWCVGALHIYHALSFPLNGDEIFHHIMFVLGMGSYCLIFQPYIASSVPLITINGLPGIIDYTLLALVKLKQVSKLTEKRVNAWLNVWIRMPITLFLAGIGYTGIVAQSRWECIPCLIMVSYNAIYYGNMAIVNHQEYRHEQQQQKMKG